jgi:uncharacterized Zn-finger protein
MYRPPDHIAAPVTHAPNPSGVKSPYPPAPLSGGPTRSVGGPGVAPAGRAPSAPTPEMITVAKGADQVSCDGGGGPLGHPVVYYSFDGGSRVECLYCDRVFVKAGI